MFNPREIIFCPTSSCNLSCSHCYVKKNPVKLSLDDALSFLASCPLSKHEDDDSGIDTIGFSGGEPFLFPDFICGICDFAIQKDIYFDRLMTNGDFWNDEASLHSVLEKVYEAGFDGHIGLSYDDFHGQSIDRVITFIKNVFDVWECKDRVEILSVIKENDNFLDKAKAIAEAFSGRVESNVDEKTGIGYIAIVPKNDTDEDDLFINICRFSESFEPEKAKWNAKKWFVDDYCEGPGQVLYVHANGDIAPCCGFANEKQALIIGNIKNSYAQLMTNAKNSSLVKDCYETGLAEVRRIMEREGYVFPGVTDDMCMFCSYLCDKQK